MARVKAQIKPKVSPGQRYLNGGPLADVTDIAWLDEGVHDDLAVIAGRGCSTEDAQQGERRSLSPRKIAWQERTESSAASP